MLFGHLVDFPVIFWSYTSDFRWFLSIYGQNILNFGHFQVILCEFWSFLECVIMSLWEFWSFLQCVIMTMHGSRHGPRHGHRYKAISRSSRVDLRWVLAIPGWFKVSFGHFLVISGDFWPFHDFPWLFSMTPVLFSITVPLLPSSSGRNEVPYLYYLEGGAQSRTHVPGRVSMKARDDSGKNTLVPHHEGSQHTYTT